MAESGVTSLYLYTAIGVSFLLTASVFLVLSKSRWKRARPNCWFCQQIAPSGYPENGWICPACKQYNGFTEDGGYDREIPEQYTEAQSTPRYCVREAPPSSQDVLCSQCHQNLQLKVVQLASFQPTSEDSFEQEAIEYEQSVEKLYPLCGACEQKVTNEIVQRNHMIRPYLLGNKTANQNADGMKPIKRKSQTWPLTVLQMASTAVVLWTLLSVIMQEFYGSSGSYNGHRIKKCNSAALYKCYEQLLPTDVTMGIPPAATAIREALRNDSCTWRRGVEWLYRPSFQERKRRACERWLRGCLAYFFRITVVVGLLVVVDVIYCLCVRTRQRLLLLLLDMSSLCLSQTFCSKILGLQESLCSNRLLSNTILATALTVRLLLSWIPSVGKRHTVKLKIQPPPPPSLPAAVTSPSNRESSPEAIHMSLGSLKIGSNRKRTPQKSWLQCVEDMNLITCSDNSHCNVDAGKNTPQTDYLATLNGTSFSQCTDSQPSSNKKPLLWAPRFHHQRASSISSAAAALSLTDSLCLGGLQLPQARPKGSNLFWSGIETSHGMGTPYSFQNGMGTPYSFQNGMETPHSFQNGMGTPYSFQNGMGTPYSFQNGMGTPHSFQNGMETPHSFQNGMETPHSFQNGMGTSHSFQNGMETPHSFQNGMETPRPFQNGMETPHSFQNGMETNHFQESASTWKGTDRCSKPQNKRSLCTYSCLLASILVASILSNIALLFLLALHVYPSWLT